ncbi:tyrosine-type recombinase/integrase [Halomonas sp. THAF12]|uniref:tyrosine-type recombinase/integrase n=1 Tax=Halomonas sp. B23F22_10 TaxID=3459515 RepID=UPI00373E8CDB
MEGEHPHGAAQLRRASPHWLRHSYVTAMGNLGASLRHLNRSAGHASIETTAQYDHASEDAWHQDMERTPLDGWALSTGPGKLAT